MGLAESSGDIGRRIEGAGLRLGLSRELAASPKFLTALIVLLALALIGGNLIHSLDEAGVRLRLLAERIASEAQSSTSGNVDAVAVLIAQTSLPGALARIEPDNGSVIGFGFELAAKAPIAGTGQAVTVSMPWHVALSPVWLRAAAVLALAGGVLFLRRRSIPEAESWMRLLEKVPFGVACWDAEGRISAVNAQFANDLGLNPQSCRAGAHYTRFISALARSSTVHVAEEADSFRMLEVCTAAGVWLSLDERPLANGGFVTFVTDISLAVEANRQLAQMQKDQRQLTQRYREEKLRAEDASRSKTAFLAHLSHDIRTPLNHIIGFADLMTHQTFGALGDPRYADYVEDIKGAGENLLASFAEILELAELESGKRQLREEPIDIAELLSATRDRFRDQARRKRVHLVVADSAPASLTGDPLGLQRMLGNLVENAVRFTPAGGRVTLTAWQAEDGIVLEVSDTGTGISQERLARLTEPFVLGDAAFTRDHDGVGLGISISRAIAELSGGEIAIESSLGIGTTVAISLPLPRADSASTERAA
jgi:two-component system cell cycle sensor histidine kinase PleC